MNNFTFSTQRFRLSKEKDLTTLHLGLVRPARLEPPAGLAQARLALVGGAAASHHPPQQGQRRHQTGGQHDRRELLKKTKPKLVLR